MRYLLLLSVLGLVLSALVHFSTFLGVDPQEAVPPVWLLHVGVFVVFVPAFFVSAQGPPDLGQKPSLNRLFAHAPAWMRLLVRVAFVYAILNFAAFFVTVAAAPGRPVVTGPGTYALRGKRGAAVRPITAAEYHACRARAVRGFSGHWMLFYAASMAAFASALARWDAPAPALPQMPPVADAGAPPQPLRYGYVATSALPVQVHEALCYICMFAGGIGGAFGAIGLIVLLQKLFDPGACCMVPILIGCFFFGLFAPPALFMVAVPARCPACGGRMSMIDFKPAVYECRTCGHKHRGVNIR
jgi:hypothetical protein